MRRQRPDRPSRRVVPVRRALSVAAICTVLAAGAGAATWEDPAALLRSVMSLVHDRFVGDSIDVYERAARGLVNELGDPYSQLLAPKQLDDFARTSLGRYAGVGMTVVPVG